jgi:hypothetical protein
MQFNTDATAALAGLLQNLQGAKTQLEAALGVVTGQAPTVPGADMGADADIGGEMPAELPAPGEEEIDDTDVDMKNRPSYWSRPRAQIMRITEVLIPTHENWLP